MEIFQGPVLAISGSCPSSCHNSLPISMTTICPWGWGQNKYDYQAIFKVLTAPLVLDELAALVTVPSLVPRDWRNCERREKAICVWMRNILPSALFLHPIQQYEVTKETCIFHYQFGNLSFITIESHPTQNMLESYSQISCLSCGWNP